MTRSILVGELSTGRRITQVPVTAASWSVKHNDVGTIDATIKLDDPKVAARPELIAALDPARCFLAVLEGDNVLEAGPIWAHSYDDSTKKLTVKAAGLRSIFSHRFVMKVLVGAENPAATVLSYTALSLGTQAKRLISAAMAHTGGSLPIVLPADEAGTHDRNYKGYELATVADRLGQLQSVVGGPDLALTPRLTADRKGIEWVLRTGTNADPLLHQPGSDSLSGGSDHIWDARVPRSGIAGINVTRDATGLAYRAWATGMGAAEGLLMDFAEDLSLTTVGFPLLESKSDHNNVSVPATLDAHATADLAGSVRPWMTWTLDVLADASPKLGAYLAGDWGKVWIPTDHPYLSRYMAAGFYRARVIGFSGDLGNKIKVDLAPTMEAR